MPPENGLASDSDRESVFSIRKEPIKPRRNSTGPKYFCSISGCKKSFKRLDHLDRHEFYHTGVKKHACTYEGCDKVYSILTHLKRHLRCTHERKEPPERNIPCSIKECGKMFQSHRNVQRHLREVHENPKVYTCLYCDEKFTQKLKMRRHEITKHTGKYPFNCEKCSKGFHQQWQYEKHLPTCKVYNCPNCPETFDKWSVYLKHCKDMQHGRKYYKCDHCSRVYAKPGELKRHIMAKHVTEDMAMEFKCTYEGCERVYAYERNLRQHIKTAHSGKRFQCKAEDCQSCFSSAQNLAKHMTRAHGDLKAKHNSSSKKETESDKPKRKKRIDAGSTVVSKLASLAGIAVDRQFDKLLRDREKDALEEATAELAKTVTEEIPSEADSISSAKAPKSSLKRTLSDDFSPKSLEDVELNQMIALVLQE